MSSDKRVVVTLSGDKPSVVFIGMWRRVDIDTAYRLMLSHLPRHLQELKTKINKEKSDE